jgi:transcriptional regulator with XRE-family HTH domain
MNMLHPIHEICKKHRISRKQLARDTNISYPALNKIVSTQCDEYPSYRTAQKLCHYLGVTPGEFLDRYASWKDSINN